MFGNLGVHVQQFPSGKWGFVGTVPMDISYTGPADQLQIGARFGFGLARDCKRLVWDTREQALAAAAAAGHHVSNAA